MRSIALWVAAALLLFNSGVSAQSRGAGLGADALPAIDRVALPAADRPRLSLAVDGALGLEPGLGVTQGSHQRTAGSVAMGVIPTHWLGLSAIYRLRNDRHPDGVTSSVDRSGDLAASARVALLLNELELGADVTLRLPGGDGLSPQSRGLSADARFLLANRAEARTRVAGQLGFRFERSHRAVDAASLQLADRFTASVGQHDMFLLGLGVSHGLGSARDFELLAEIGADVLIGTGGDELARSPLRAGAGARYHAGQSVQLQLMLHASGSARPGPETEQSLIPIEPRVGAQLGIRLSFPTGPPPPAPAPAPGPDPDPDSDSETETDSDSETETETESGSVPEPVPEPESGSGSDPVPEFGSGSGSGSGSESESVPVPVPVPESEAASEAEASGAVVRGHVRSFSGQPLKATATLYPGQWKVVTDEQGYFELEVEPGRYTVRVRSYGHRSQNRKIRVRENGVTVINVDLRKSRKKR